MRKLVGTLTISVLFMLCAKGLQAQTLDQTALMKQFLGKWQSSVMNDTAEVWDFQQSGNTFTSDVNFLVKGKKTPFRKGSAIYSPEMVKFKGTELMANGSKDTWLGSFISDKKFSIDFVQDFNPQVVFWKLDIVFDSPSSFTMTGYSKDGVKAWDRKYTRLN
ncbi:MAG: hypothetical protein U0W24_14600 [Bacteroidales bacterium]